MSAARTMAACLDSARTDSRARPFSDETFEALRIRAANGIMGKSGEASLIGTYETFDAAREAASLAAMHKDVIAVKRHNVVTNRTTLHFYAIKRKSQPVYRHHNHETRRCHDLYADHLHDLVLDATVLG